MITESPLKCSINNGHKSRSWLKFSIRPALYALCSLQHRCRCSLVRENFVWFPAKVVTTSTFRGSYRIPLWWRHTWRYSTVHNIMLFLCDLESLTPPRIVQLGKLDVIVIWNYFIYVQSYTNSFVMYTVRVAIINWRLETTSSIQHSFEFFIKFIFIFICTLRR